MSAYQRFLYDIQPHVLATRATEGLFTYIGPTLLAVAIWVGSIVAGLIVYEVIMMLGYGCNWRYRLQKRRNSNVLHLIALVLEIVIVIVGTAVSFSVVGLSFSILVSIGVLSLVVTYAAVPVLSNVSAAFFLYTGSFFVEGQWAYLDAIHQGQIVEIGKMVTVLEDVYENNVITHIIPNKLFFERPTTIYQTRNGYLPFSHGRRKSRTPVANNTRNAKEAIKPGILQTGHSFR